MEANFITAPIPGGLAVDGALVQRFIAYIDREPATVKGYLTCLRRFLGWLEGRGIRQPQRGDVLAYKAYLESPSFGPCQDCPLSPTTRGQYLRAVRQFFRWTAAEGLYPNIADNIHGPKLQKNTRRKDSLDREAVRAIARSIDRTGEAGKRLYAMYLLCITGGLRTIELSRANVEDVRREGTRAYLYVQGKGHSEKDQPVLLVEEVLAALGLYLESREAPYTGKSPLFVSTSNRSRGRRIAPTTISTMLKSAMVRAGYDSPRLTAHSLRHTSGTGAYLATGSLYLAQLHQRHADPATTEIYVHAQERAQRDTEKAVYEYYFGEDGR